MGVQQKSKDLILLLKEDRKAQVIAACIGIAIIFLMTHKETPPKPRGDIFLTQQQDEDSLGMQNSSEVIQDLQQVVVQRLDKHQEVLDHLTNDLKKTNERIEETEIRTAEIFETLLKRIPSNPGLPSGAGGDDLGAIPQDLSDIPDPDSPLPGDELESFGNVEDEGTVAPPELEEADARTAYIAPTDFVRVKLLAGVNAPTDGTPYPVLFEVIGDVQSPDGGSLPLGSARMLAAAQGSLIDSRALFRVTTLTMRLPSGETLDVDVDGWVVGEDGIRGMSGKPIDPLGKILGATALTGAVAGAGEALSDANTRTYVNGLGGVTKVVTGSTAEYALGQGISETGQLWTDIIRERVNEAVPAIQVFSGREATVVFSQGTKIPRLYELIDAGEQDVFSGMD